MSRLAMQSNPDTDAPIASIFRTPKYKEWLAKANTKKASPSLHVLSHCYVLSACAKKPNCSKQLGVIYLPMLAQTSVWL
ncbi:hypothetical protein [Allocoleopsis sp.]|uniref:hypothetical protein n=1 Tax=Allocoleopsis sp. TaxID=3088169 RepID=UPI002FD2E481